jgi:chemotaxis protein MotB
MARRRRSSPPAGAIPAWFMTYSDVITLLMTFFILLLTFATSEPERFAQMQVVTFGGAASATGVVAENPFALERDALVLRVRPWSSRVGSHGSEMPPLYVDPPLESMAKGLAHFDLEEELANRQAFHFDLEWSVLFDERGTPSEYAAERFRLLAVQMRRLPLEVRLQVPTTADLPSATQLADQLRQLAGIPAGRISVGVRPEGASSSRVLRVIVTRGDQTRFAGKSPPLR